MRKFFLGLGLGALLLYRKQITVSTLQTLFSANNKIKEITSEVKEEWEDIIAEANFEHLNKSIEKDIASSKGDNNNEQR